MSGGIPQIEIAMKQLDVLFSEYQGKHIEKDFIDLSVSPDRCISYLIYAIYYHIHDMFDYFLLGKVSQKNLVSVLHGWDDDDDDDVVLPFGSQNDDENEDEEEIVEAYIV